APPLRANIHWFTSCHDVLGGAGVFEGLAKSHGRPLPVVAAQKASVELQRLQSRDRQGAVCPRNFASPSFSPARKKCPNSGKPEAPKRCSTMSSSAHYHCRRTVRTDARSK